MIELIQRQYDSKELGSFINKLNEMQITVNLDLVNKDIERLNKEKELSNNNYNIKNINNIIKLLNNMIKHTNNDNNLELCWVQHIGELPKTYPLSIIDEPLYRINMLNYIEIGQNEQLVDIDYKDLVDILAMEYMYRDLGETHESIENILDNCGLIAVEESDTLIKYIRSIEDDIYDLANVIGIEDCPYINIERGLIKDYFNSKEFCIKNKKNVTYADVIKYSAKYAMTIITNNIIKKATTNNIQFKLIRVGEHKISLIINNLSSDTLNIILEDVCIRAFGRKFKAKPIVTNL